MKAASLTVAILAFVATNCFAESTAPTKQIPAKIICGPHSSDPQKLPAWQNNLSFNLVQGVMTAERETSDRPGKETFRGIISPLGAVLIVGEGGYVGGSAWVYEFQGKIDDKGHTTLKGMLRNTVGAVGSRACSIIL